MVHAQRVDRAFAAAELRAEPSEQHVGGLPLEAAEALGLGHLRRIGAARRHDVHQRVDVQEARARQHLADARHRRQRRGDQTALDLEPVGQGLPPRVAAFADVRVDQVRFTDRPGEVADLVDRRDPRCRTDVRRERTRGSLREIGEARDQVVVEQAHARRDAVVHERPRDLEAVPSRGLGHRDGAREVVSAVAVAVGQAPADALARPVQAHLDEARVVALELVRVPRDGDHVERHAMSVDMVGTLEPAHPEALHVSLETKGAPHAMRRVGNGRASRPVMSFCA